MAISVADNFSYKGSKPLDARIQYATVANMKNATTTDLYDGCLAYVMETKKNYQYDSSNTSDPTLGKWRELQTGGGGTGGGHVIENDGTDLTQRDTLNFVDMNATDDDTNEKTKVAPHRLTSAELQEIVDPLPNAATRLPVLFDERGTEYQVGWYVNSNGLRKPVYEKVLIKSGSIAKSAWNVIGTIPNVDRCISFKGAVQIGTTSDFFGGYRDSNVLSQMEFDGSRGDVNVYIGAYQFITLDAIWVSIRYTKTTDSFA